MVHERFAGDRKGGEDDFLVKRVLSRSEGEGVHQWESGHLRNASGDGEELVSLCGQHEHQSLQRVETHIDILDEFGQTERTSEEFENRFQNLCSLRESGESGKKERRDKEQELAVFQANETTFRDSTGEEERLKEEQRILAHARN